MPLTDDPGPPPSDETDPPPNAEPGPPVVPVPAPPPPPLRGAVLRWLFGIRARIFLSLALLSTLLLLAVALGIERQARSELEGELTLRLHAVGGAAVSALGPGVVPALVHLGPRQGDSPFYQDRRAVLLQLKQRTGVRRIFLADTAGHSFLDTDPRVAIGAPLTQLLADRLEVREAMAGRPSAVALFDDETGQPRKTGYVPVTLDGRTIALIGVEADATFLRALRALRSRILGVGLIGILAAFLFAVPVARGLTRPLRGLVEWARRFGSGELTRPVPARGRDEIAFLGRTLEQMRLDLAARDREQRAMVAGVAHEVRNPLGGLRLYAELLADDPTLGERSRERLRKMLAEMNRLGAIVDEFLLYARPTVAEETGNDLGEVLTELLEWIAPSAEQRGVTLCGEPPDSRWPQVAADANHLRQILRNLIQNAVEACGRGQRVRVGARAEGESVRVWVEDDGPGVSAEARGRIFEPFFTTKATGAGLGLPIVRQLARLNGARVELEPGPEPGARFVVFFRRWDGAARPAAGGNE